MNIKWKKNKEEKGILVAFDATFQPLILWWYKSLRKYSSLPIAFINLGNISENVKNWCKKNGYYYDLQKYVKNFKKIKIPQKYKNQWAEQISGDVASVRPYWFTKPVALMTTPFEKTLYLDIDCQVNADINDFFLCLDEYELALVKYVFQESFSYNKKNITIFNSGVIGYKTKAKIIEEWAELSLKFKHDFLGDQDLLSDIIHENKYVPKILPMEWNWQRLPLLNENAKILHHCGGLAKSKLFETIKKDPILIEEIKKLLS
jgi:hypothetical protein